MNGSGEVGKWGIGWEWEYIQVAPLGPKMNVVLAGLEFRILVLTNCAAFVHLPNSGA